MKISLKWLREHLETNANDQEIITRLNALGLVVDDVLNHGEGLKDFLIAEIMEAHPHPNADRLKVCRVNTGPEVIQVVCGAPNARPGLKSVFAPVGTRIPASGVVLKPTKIRDVESFGMMCSHEELGMGQDHTGIIELPEDAPVGVTYVSWAGLDDVTLDLDVTPNRGDCLGIRGVARDLAASGMGNMKPLSLSRPVSVFPSPLSVSIDLSDQTLCPHFAGRIIRGVKNGPSPAWIQQKLKSAGLRPISALVDITNLMMLEHGRPMHVFDVAMIQGNLCVRSAQDGENLKTLDGQTSCLETGMIVVADERGPLSVAGVMGGLESGCTPETTTVFLESALFDRISIAMTGRKLGLHSDSRSRFERGVDPQLVMPVLDEATRLILDICGGEASEVTEAGAQVNPETHFIFNPDVMVTHGGLEVSRDEIIMILERLGFRIEPTGTGQDMQVWVPSWRHDVSHPLDLVEEVLRIKGYDVVPAVKNSHEVLNPSLESHPGSRIRQNREWIVRRALAARGMNETMTWSFTSSAFAALFGGNEPGLHIENPISQDLSVMRPSLLPNLCVAIGKALARGQESPAFFEVGSQFANPSPGGRKTAVTGVRSPRHPVRHWQSGAVVPDPYLVKADVLALLAACGVDPSKPRIEAGAPEWYHPGRSAILQLGPGKILAVFGEIHPRVLKLMDIPGPLYAFEVFLSELPGLKAGTRKTPVTLSAYQPVERDLAFILDNAVPAARIMEIIRKADRDLIQAVSVFDQYEGPNVGEGRKSVAFSFRLEPRERTLTDAEINGLMSKIIENVKSETGGELRS